MAKLLETPAPGFPGFGEGLDWNEVAKRHDEEFAKLRAISDSLPENEVVGYILHFPIADGQALYRVVKAKPFTLQHIPYSDGYAIPAAHMRGLRLADVQRQRDFAKFWRKHG